MQWMHQVNIYMHHLSSKDKGTTKNNHEEDECDESSNVN
jgi:hypothetical protein